MDSSITDRLVADVQIACEASHIPSQALIERWLDAALVAAKGDYSEAEVSIRIVDLTESQTLNHDYRQKDKPTNVLSFPAEIPDFIDSPLLGDLVVCAPVVEREAQEQSKTLDAHWAHMLIHGTLHLIGYDHIDDSDAIEMETLETRILTGLGFGSPYEEQGL